MNRSRRSLRIITAFLVLVTPISSFAWNPKGHRVNASVFPDDAHSEPWRRYGRSPAHYVNYRILADQGNRVEPPVRGENILNSYVAHLRQIQTPRTPVEDKALHLSWVFHQAGDIHQPLHAVARFSKALPEGDRGGNEVHIPNPRGQGERSNNLHAYSVVSRIFCTNVSPI